MALKYPERIRPWRHAEFWFFAVIYCFTVLLLLSAPGGEFDLAKWARGVLSLFGIMLLLFIGLYFVPPKPFVKLEGGEIFIWRPGIKPKREWIFQVDEVEKVEIFGPKGGRQWRVHLKAGEKVTIPPIGNALLEKEQTRFMQLEVSRYVSVEVRSPPTMFAQVRGDADWDEEGTDK